MVTQSTSVSRHNLFSIVREIYGREQMTLWMIWTWIWLFGAYCWMPLFEQQFILDKTIRWMYDTWRIIFGTVWDSYSTKLEKTDQWTTRIHWYKDYRFKDATWMSTADCAKKLISSPTPKPSSSPTLCSAWEKWEMILLRPGKAKLSGIRITITSRTWIESMECQRSSSGKYSQESQRWASSRRFKK